MIIYFANVVISIFQKLRRMFLRLKVCGLNMQGTCLLAHLRVTFPAYGICSAAANWANEARRGIPLRAKTNQEYQDKPEVGTSPFLKNPSLRKHQIVILLTDDVHNC